MKTILGAALAVSAILAAGFLASGCVFALATAEDPVGSEPGPRQTVTSGGGSALSSYRIGPEDVLHVSVWENKELTLNVVVRPDGKISLPLVQDVQAEGLTATELASEVQKRLLNFIKEPQVAVVVEQVNSPKVYVLGNVAKPGALPLRGEMSVLQALSLSGGFTQFASPRNLRLVRGTGAAQEVRKLNYFDLIDNGGRGNDLLHPGDTIVVP